MEKKIKHSAETQGVQLKASYIPIYNVCRLVIHLATLRAGQGLTSHYEQKQLAVLRRS